MLGAPLPVRHIRVPFAPCSHATFFLRPAARPRRQLRCSWKGGHMSLPPFPPILCAGGQVSASDSASNRLCKTCVRLAVFNLASFDPSAGSWQSPCETSGSAPDSSSPSAGLPRSSFGDVKEPSVVVCSSDEETELLAPLKEEQFDLRFSRCFGPPISCRWRRPQAREKLASPAEREYSFRVREILNQVVRSEIEDPKAHALRLAAGRIKASPFSAGALRRARTEIASLLPDPELALQVFRSVGMPHCRGPHRSSVRV